MFIINNYTQLPLPPIATRSTTSLVIIFAPRSNVLNLVIHEQWPRMQLSTRCSLSCSLKEVIGTLGSNFLGEPSVDILNPSVAPLRRPGFGSLGMISRRAMMIRSGGGCARFVLTGASRTLTRLPRVVRRTRRSIYGPTTIFGTLQENGRRRLNLKRRRRRGISQR